MSKKVVLKLDQISKDYMQGRSIIEVLKKVDLKVFAGQMIAIIGASGSGKSTLLHIAGLLDLADSGIVAINGIEQISKGKMVDANKMRLNNIGFIYQNHHLLKDFTAQENVAIPLLLAGKRKEEAMEISEDLLASLGLGTRLCNVPGELSGGEKQRVAIARALINEPKLILADEPTGNLDPSTAKSVFDTLLERAEKFGAAVIMVSHNLELASKMHKTYRLSGSLTEV